MMHNCRIIGITGGIGSGKSVVSRILRLNGYFVFDCDFEAAGLMKNDIELRESIRQILGECAYTPAGDLDKKYISSIIFSDPIKRENLNKIVHAKVLKKFKEKAIDKDLAFMESAILKSSGFYTCCDMIWLVVAPLNLRIERIMKRNSLSEKEIEARISSQTNEFLASSPNILIIENNGINPVLDKILLFSNNKTLNKEEYYVEENLVNHG